MGTQEWNYHTRRDANATIIIARRTKLDSSQMKTISRLGMIFLPGTFLAVRIPQLGVASPYSSSLGMMTLSVADSA